MKKILVIEDDERICKALTLRLKSAGYDVNTAGDAISGLVSAVKLQPDLILLDISMPGGNGLTLAERVNSLLPTPPRIIFLTASKQPDIVERVCALGAVGFFEKPYLTERLLAAIAARLSDSPFATAN